MIIVAQSADFMTTFPDNNSNDFRFSLLRRENFLSSAKIALLEIIVPPSEHAKVCYIYCSAAQYSQCNGRWRRVVRVIDVQPTKSPEKFTFVNPIYFDLFNKDFDEIRISLKDEKDVPLKFESDYNTTVVLDLNNGSL